MTDGRGTPTRDLSLVILAGVVAVTYTVAIVVLAISGHVGAAVAVGALAPISNLASFALGRLSGANAAHPGS